MRVSRKDVADEIERFLTGTGGSWDWDDFVSVQFDDPELEGIRKTCASLPMLYPPTVDSAYCDEQGVDVLRSILRNLRAQSV